MTAVFEDILACDLLLLASPIYLWSCTAPMKAALDRCIYALCKYYGDEKGPSLWEGKAVAAITTCGCPLEKGADLWQESLRRICKHARLRWLGLYGATWVTKPSLWIRIRRRVPEILPAGL